MSGASKYYEAWSYIYDKTNPQRVTLNLTDDTFRYSAPADETGSSQGSFSITGDAAFFQGYRLDPADEWKDKEACNKMFVPWEINLPCTKKAPVNFAQPKARVKRELSMEWSCKTCPVGCNCDRCIGSLDGGHLGRKTYRCRGCAD